MLRDPALKTLIYLVVAILLFFIPLLILRARYGPSYYFLSGHDCWMPDGNGGWVKHGVLSGPPPKEPSVKIPLLVMYSPLLLPVLFLACLSVSFCARYWKRDSTYLRGRRLPRSYVRNAPPYLRILRGKVQYFRQSACLK